MTYHPEHAGVIPENTLGLDQYTMLEYRFYLHRDEFRERMYEAEPGQISFSGATWDPSEGYFVMDTGWDLHQGFTNSEMVDRIDELVAEGLDGETAERQIMEEMLDEVNDFDAAWSNDLIPKVIIRVASPEAFHAEVMEWFRERIEDWRSEEASASDVPAKEPVPPSVEEAALWLESHLEAEFGWCEIHWMDRCDPVHAELPVAWGAGGSVELLAPASAPEIEWMGDVFTDLMNETFDC